jgi:hypothetical protein
LARRDLSSTFRSVVEQRSAQKSSIAANRSNQTASTIDNCSPYTREAHQIVNKQRVVARARAPTLTKSLVCS